MLGLTAVLAYGATAFAEKTEDQVRLNVSKDLTHRGFDWVEASVSGQEVTLTGVAPSLEAHKGAVEVATQSRCRTWLGSLPCATNVSEKFTRVEDGASEPSTDKWNSRDVNSTNNAVSPGSARSNQHASAHVPNDGADPGVLPTPANPTQPEPGANIAGDPIASLRIVRQGNSVKLEGSGPSAESRTELENLARTHFPSGAVENRLDVTGNVDTAEWTKTATYAFELAARCEQGMVSIEGGSLNVDCETQTASAKEAFNAVLRTRPPTLTEGNINVLALDEVKSCEEALVKLVTRSQIRFTTNSAKLLPTSRPLLREIAHQLERCPGVVVVEGHTDGQGDREENVTLSLNRARAVVAGLVGLGVPATRVRAEGFGPDQPLATNATATGRAQNRRIEFRVARTGIRGE